MYGILRSPPYDYMTAQQRIIFVISLQAIGFILCCIAALFLWLHEYNKASIDAGEHIMWRAQCHEIYHA